VINFRLGLLVTAEVRGNYFRALKMYLRVNQFYLGIGNCRNPAIPSPSSCHGEKTCSVPLSSSSKMWKKSLAKTNISSPFHIHNFSGNSRASKSIGCKRKKMLVISKNFFHVLNQANWMLVIQVITKIASKLSVKIPYLPPSNPQFYIQLVKRPHFGTLIILFGIFEQSGQ
jgi:hypothetical protein